MKWNPSEACATEVERIFPCGIRNMTAVSGNFGQNCSTVPDDPSRTSPWLGRLAMARASPNWLLSAAQQVRA
jgi:hypothetical protein